MSKKVEIKKSDIKKWVAALRSGDYEQTTGQLQDAKGFCCLGVACKVFIPKEKQKLVDGTEHLRGWMPPSQEHSPAWLLEVDNDFSNKTLESLAELNDEDKLTFDEIADCLEAVYIHEVLTY